jgi:hypothetical protein
MVKKHCLPETAQSVIVPTTEDWRIDSTTAHARNANRSSHDLSLNGRQFILVSVGSANGRTQLVALLPNAAGWWWRQAVAWCRTRCPAVGAPGAAAPRLSLQPAGSWSAARGR